MIDRYAAIGWTGKDVETAELISTAVRSGVTRVDGDGDALWLLTDGSGAGIAAAGRRRPLAVEAAKPYFARHGSPRTVARFAAIHEGAGGYLAAVQVDIDGTTVTFEAPNTAEIRNAFIDAVGEPFEVSFTLFAETVEDATATTAGTFHAEAAHRDRQAPRATVTGTVLDAALMTNRTTGATFARLTVAAGTVELDVLVAPRVLGELPRPGTAVQVDGWLAGIVHTDRVASIDAAELTHAGVAVVAALPVRQQRARPTGALAAA